MVRTDNDIENMPPLERLKMLRMKEQERKQEIEELEQKKKEELEHISSELSETVREIAEDEEKIFKEEDERKKLEELRKQISLEEKVEEVKTERREFSNNTYISSALMTPGADVNFYDVANTGLYNRVKELIEKADTGYISSDDRQFLSNVQEHIDRLKRVDIYNKKDEHHYLQRTSALLDRFDV